MKEFASILRMSKWIFFCQNDDSDKKDKVVIINLKSSSYARTYISGEFTGRFVRTWRETQISIQRIAWSRQYLKQRNTHIIESINKADVWSINSQVLALMLQVGQYKQLATYVLSVAKKSSEWVKTEVKIINDSHNEES